jgi:copper chaperone
MTTLKFKTNINCGGCIAKVTPFLNNEPGIEKWEVDILHPEKTLTVQTNASANKVMEAVKKAGFKIELSS